MSVQEERGGKCEEGYFRPVRDPPLPAPFALPLHTLSAPLLSSPCPFIGIDGWHSAASQTTGRPVQVHNGRRQDQICHPLRTKWHCTLVRCEETPAARAIYFPAAGEPPSVPAAASLVARWSQETGGFWATVVSAVADPLPNILLDPLAIHNYTLTGTYRH